MKFYLMDDYKGRTCCYEEWDKETRHTKPCGKPASIALGKLATSFCLCPLHALFSVDERSEVQMQTINPVTGKTGWKDCTGKILIKYLEGRIDA